MPPNNDNNVISLESAMRGIQDDIKTIADEPALKSGGGGGKFEGMDTVNAKIAAAEARTDTKFAALRGDLKDFATKGDLHRTVWSATAVIIATIMAMIAFGGDRFDAGLGMADHRDAQLARDAKQDEAVKRIEAKIDQLLDSNQPISTR